MCNNRDNVKNYNDSSASNQTNLQTDGLAVAIIARLLGAFFYYSPKSAIVQSLTPALLQIDKCIDWLDLTTITKQCYILAEEIDNPNLEYQFALLFEGQGEMEAPPWGSVYLDREQLLMGDSAERYRLFLLQNGIKLDTGMNEPEDQFGLMLMAFALLLEQNRSAAAKSLIDDHLLSWSHHYLEKLTNNSISPFYQALAEIAKAFLAVV